MHRELLEELKLRLGNEWTHTGMTWEATVKLIKDMLGITKPAIIYQLSALKQGDNVPAHTFVAKYDRVIRELGGLDEELAKTYLANALNTRTRESLNDAVCRYVMKEGVGETREAQWAAVSYEDMKKVLRSKDTFSSMGEQADLGTYVNGAHQTTAPKKKAPAQASTHAVTGTV